MKEDDVNMNDFVFCSKCGNKWEVRNNLGSVYKREGLFVVLINGIFFSCDNIEICLKDRIFDTMKGKLQEIEIRFSINNIRFMTLDSWELFMIKTIQIDDFRYSIIDLIRIQEVT